MSIINKSKAIAKHEENMQEITDDLMQGFQSETGNKANQEKSETVHHSDGSELIPSEIPSDLHQNDRLVAGYTADDEGIINSYALEPAISTAEYPTPKQQMRYIILGIGAIVLIASILFIAFSVS
jgi:hypothetical protein